MSLRYVRVAVEPTYEPVTRAEAKEWCRIDDDDTSQDAVVDLLLRAVRERAEEITGRSFAQRTVDLIMDQFPSGPEVIELPFPPVLTVESITYIDTNGAAQVLDGSPTQWILDTDTARVEPLFGTSWPNARKQAGAVKIRYTAGYSAIGSPDGVTEKRDAIPALARLWMRARISTLYENREHLIVNNMVEMPRDFLDGLLDGLRTTRLFA